MRIDRSSLTKTGGLGSTEVSKVFSLPTMCGWTNDAIRSGKLVTACQLRMFLYTSRGSQPVVLSQRRDRRKCHLEQDAELSEATKLREH